MSESHDNESRDDGPFTQQAHRGNQPRREKRDVHGWIILDKPVGMTSTHAVARIKRLFSAKRAGHAGGDARPRSLRAACRSPSAKPPRLFRS